MSFAVIIGLAALGGLLFGYDTGVISSALLFIRKEFHLPTGGESLVAAIVLLGAAVLFVIGALLSAFAPGAAVLMTARLVVGFASMLTPLYLAEIAPTSSRGAATSINQLCITGGILVPYLVGYAFAEVGDGWRWMLGLGAVPGAILGLGMLVPPESPRWLADHPRPDRARRAAPLARQGRRHRSGIAIAASRRQARRRPGAVVGAIGGVTSAFRSRSRSASSPERSCPTGPSASSRSRSNNPAPAAGA